MQSYKSINSKKPSKLKKLIIIIVVIAVLMLAALVVIGIITNPDNAEMQNVSATVSENVQLKQQVSELQQQIEDLQAQIERLNNDLSARPTIEPTPYAPMESADPIPTETVVPR